MLSSLLNRGTLVTVVMLMVMLLGIIAATRVPVQMIPDLDARTISIETQWAGATPQDVEKEIIIEQEDYLRSIPNLKRMTSSASTGNASIELEFPFGIDVNEALLRVNNALSQVPSYPENVDEPVLYTNSFSENAFMSFRVVPLPGNPMNLDIDLMLDFVDDNIRTAMERVPGISQVSIGGGAERQIQILVDTPRLAERGLSLTQLRDAIRARNIDLSAGDIDQGKRRYLIRTIGRFDNIEELNNLILSRSGDAITRLRDVATIKLDHFEIRSRSYADGDSNLRLSLYRQPGSNVITIKYAILPVVEQINRDILNPAGLQMLLSNEDVKYVEDSVQNVWKNLLIGAGLATAVMFLFLRSASATLIGMCGMPVCVVASFIGLLVMGRTINVISLAGIAFAIGMTIDNTIVVLESIQQERQKGKTRFQAALHGTQNVWAAVLSGTMTTVLVFLPLLFVQEEAGQLFSDIGIAISFSILISMLVAVTLVPVACANLPERTLNKQTTTLPKRRQFLLTPLYWLLSTKPRRYATILITLLLTSSAVYFLTPPAEYLPEGEEAKAFSSMIAPPGYNLPEMEKIALQVQDQLLPLMKDDPADFDNGKTQIPALSRVTIIAQPQSLRIIAETKDPGHIDAYIEKVNQLFRQYPGMRAFSSRGSIISSNDGGTRAVNLDISGPELPAIYDAANTTFRLAGEVLENPQINSEPNSLTLGQPLLQIQPNWERLAELDISAEELGYAIAAQSDGAFVDEFFIQDDKIDIFLYSQAINQQDLSKLPDLTIFTPRGNFPLSALATITETVDSANIRRVDGRRTITLYIIPPRTTPLETAVDQVRQNVVQHLRETNALPPGVTVDLSGAADQLDATRDSLGTNLWVAVALCYLQLVIIYRHWGDPLIILITVPLGISGGIAGLWLLNFVGALMPSIGLPEIRQPFDMITMLGFLILLGTAVNNPILIVDRAMHNHRIDGMSVIDSVKDALQSRLRPIMMTTCTTLIGLAPPVFLPGAGTELYRGVGAIILFGLAFTSLITLTFLPALLISWMKIGDKLRPAKNPSVAAA
ncbi:efflux RND transporter permease subunit [Phragmitibacter flavus]|uniref:Efflux RND transporter permease subunit n=1 Tax=Phragmitibacter flavus TaxID=2576071 RepID=A0A5R8KA30_9BACT|nr:efflux RND transporter permease subunit [Phragmitibacter flavus]TLD69164.1 efflux RND transporter permease subunit [Phragmitibacter flavus]